MQTVKYTFINYMLVDLHTNILTQKYLCAIFCVAVNESVLKCEITLKCLNVKRV